MNERIKDKIKKVEEYLNNVIYIIPPNMEAYNEDYKVRWLCEHGFEKIAEAISDLAFLIIKDQKFEKARDDISAFDVLSKNKVIGDLLCEKLKDLRRMKNVISHKYGEIDNEKVFHSISEELENDINDYLSSIEKI